MWFTKYNTRTLKICRQKIKWFVSNIYIYLVLGKSGVKICGPSKSECMDQISGKITYVVNILNIIFISYVLIIGQSWDNNKKMMNQVAYYPK